MKNSPKLFMVLSMTIFGCLAPFVREINITSAELALYRALMALVLIGGFLLIKKEKIPFKNLKREIILLFISGAAMGFNWILLFEAYKYTTVSVATLSYYFAPVLVMVVSPLLFREKPTIVQILCFILSTAGLVMIIGVSDTGQDKSTLTGILFGLSAAVLYASVIILNKFIKSVSGINRTFLQFVAAAIVLIPYVGFAGGTGLGGLDSKGIVCLLIVGLIHTGLAYCMYFSSLASLSGQETAMFSYIDPLVAVAISVTLLGENMSVWQAVGGAMILVFTFINDRIKLRKST